MTMTPEEELEYLRLLDAEDKVSSRADFLRFYMRMTGFLPPRHVHVIARMLQAMEEDKIDRAMVFAPPRHAKTLLGTTLFPAWIMGRHPDTKIMSVVHTGRYAGKVGRSVRNLTRSGAWPFDEVALADDSQARDQWATSQGGEYNAFGVIGGNQHGNPAEWLFMDDLVKGRKIAMSAHMRDEVWETYKTDLVSRLQGRRKQLMVFTRWHMDDPAGRILPEDFDGRTGWYQDRENGEPWFVLSMPALAEHEADPATGRGADALGRKPGEWLWPERFGESALGGVMKRGGWVWSALYQQRPSPEEGLLFTKDHIARYKKNAIDITRMTIYGASDYATKAEAGAPDPDYTVHLVFGVDDDFNIYLLDGWRARTESDKWATQFCRLVLKWKPLRWAEESGQIIGSVGPFLKIIMRREHVYVDRLQFTSSINKEARAQALLGMAAMGKLFLPDRATCDPELLPLLDALEAELLTFPTGRHDDCVDAMTLFARMLDRIIAGRKPKPQGSPQGDTLDDLWSRHEQAMKRQRRE